ncbi:MAG: metallopeptidase family protein [Verrucomicrobiaceae bacterium]|jgi:predicted Zn-dependent protease with MMP-like domain|nr:metallopeptidase family protein [Verrucomicrobiaceae bacterium]
MRPERLEELAQRVVRVTMHHLPERIKTAVRPCRIELEWIDDCLAAGEDLPGDDLLGLFEGASLSDPMPDDLDSLPRIRLFLDSLWDYAEGDPEIFRQEVRITLLHELGHYLGLNEDQVANMGLE